MLRWFGKRGVVFGSTVRTVATESLHNRTWIVVETPKDEPGALLKAISSFEKFGVNMTHIESRLKTFTRTSPTFHIDFEGKRTDDKVIKLLEHLKSTCVSVNVMDERPVPWFPMNIRDLNLTRDTLDAGTGLINEDHPGFHDQEYRSRRNELASLAHDYQHGQPLPLIQYNPREVETWGVVYSRLKERHKQFACRELNAVMPEMEKYCGYAPNNIPQLRDISDFLQQRTGFTLRPVQGLLSARDFLNALAFRVFFSTQYIRHHGNPLYTPEPDVCHELIGHVPLFADPDFADFSHEIGLASLAANDHEIAMLSTNYWFTVEFGLCRENGDVKAFGAGLLSSFGEIEWACSPSPSLECRKNGGLDVSLTKPNILPFDPFFVAEQQYPITSYQPTYFICDSLAQAKEKMRTFCDSLHRPFFPQYDPLTQNILASKAVRRLPRTTTVQMQAAKQKEFFENARNQ
eukprot:c4701_g1_i1.p1 GENE.c4701_g1_i1~~c4701_g1_i1.p1  ORF type:complete len:461 (+),score=103.70 c4701_g1_i1:33-1415(+)